MTNETITAPKKRKPMILAAICFILCVFTLVIDSALPYLSNLFGLPANFMIDGTALETLVRVIIAIFLLTVAVMLFLGKKGALLYVPLFLLGGGHILLWACELSYDLIGMEGLKLNVLIKYVLTGLFYSTPNLLTAFGILLMAVWILFASKGKMLKLWFVPFIVFMLPAAVYFVFLVMGIFAETSLALTSFATYFFTIRTVKMLLALAYTLCAFFTCLNIKKNS